VPKNDSKKFGKVENAGKRAVEGEDDAETFVHCDFPTPKNPIYNPCSYSLSAQHAHRVNSF
jgi:hypothetical protein